MPKEPEKKCYLCANKIEKIDYKDTNLLQKFTTLQGKIRPPRKTGLCAKHKRKVAKTIKRARTMAIVPIVKR